jgi:glycosyltransferase involved in cell wall biosynthesis
MVTREHNMAAFNRITAGKPELLTGATLIYDAEAVSAPREVLRRRLLGEQISDAELDAAIRAEVELARNAQHIVAVSEREADYFRRFGFEQLTVLGHQLPEKPTKKPFDQRQGLLFVGALRDEGSPNVDSLLWFVINVLPLIEAEVPDVTLTVVGDSSAPSLATLQKNNIEINGRLDSIAPFYKRSKVFIAPTRFAAGIPHKVHEAASRGLPSVTTSLLATQLGWEDGQQLLVADSPERFARQCIRLLTEESLWNSIRDNGLQAVSADCSAQKFDTAMRALFGQHSNPAER